MSVLMIYALYSTVALANAEYIFEFEGRKFRLVKGPASPRDETDKLCTIIHDHLDQDEDKEVHESVLRLMDRLSWTWGVGIYCVGSSGFGFKEGR